MNLVHGLNCCLSCVFSGKWFLFCMSFIRVTYVSESSERKANL